MGVDSYDNGLKSIVTDKDKISDLIDSGAFFDGPDSDPENDPTKLEQKNKLSELEQEYVEVLLKRVNEDLKTGSEVNLSGYDLLGKNKVKLSNNQELPNDKQLPNDQQVYELLEGIENKDKVEYLDLKSNFFVTKVPENLSKFPNLKYIDFTGTDLQFNSSESPFDQSLLPKSVIGISPSYPDLNFKSDVPLGAVQYVDSVERLFNLKK